MKVEVSGLYKATHDPWHTRAHEVICMQGKVFPPAGAAIILALYWPALPVVSKITNTLSDW